jgi:hypothetical protein
MRKILFIDDCNMFEGENPRAYLVELKTEISTHLLHVLENSQRGVGRMGGKWRQIMEDGKLEFNLVSQGVKSDYIEGTYDELYKVISGNY